MPVKFLEKVVRIALYGTALTALVIVPIFFVFPYIVPKVIFLRVLIAVSVAGYALLLYYKRKEYGVYTSPILYAVLFLLISSLISTFVGVDWRMSLWNNQERMLGTFTFIHYVLFYIVARQVLNTKVLWERMMMVVGSAALPVIFIGIFQKINPDFLLNRGAGRVVSTLGNPIFLAGYGLFLVFIGAANAVEQKGKIRLFYALVALMGLIGIFLSGTRGTMVGLLVGLFVGVVLYGIQRRDNKKVKIVTAVIMALVVLFGGLIFAYRETQFIRNLPIIGNMASASFSEGTGRTRVMAWEIAVKSWKEKPFFGWGPNNYSYAFNKYYNPDFLKFGFQETWFDNAHNVLLNILSTQGVLGAAAYVFVFIACWHSLWKIYKKNPKRAQVVIILASFLVAHFFHNIFVFENITSYWYFFFLLAYIDWLGREEISINTGVSLKASIPVVLVTTGICVVFILFANATVIWGNIYEYKARFILSQGKVNESLAYLETGRKIWNPYQSDIDADMAMDILGIVMKVNTYNKDLARKIYDIAVVNMEGVIRVHPLDVRSYLGLIDLLRSGGLVLFNLPVEDNIKQYLETAKQLSPARQEVQYAEITFIAGTGEVEKAIAEARALVEKDKTIAEGYYTLGRLYYFSQQYKKILKTMDEAIDAGIRWSDPEHQIFAAETYEREGRFLDALYWYGQAYKATGNERIKYKRDELSSQTQLAVPKNLEDFFFSEIKRYD